ncbi:MAG: PQQ-binding-like beta-propeller repeat protein [Actinomycetota bacterium]
MRSARHLLSIIVVVLCLVACGADGSPGDGGDRSAGYGPAPIDMCPEGEYPILAAYAIDDGEFQWVTCGTNPDMHEAVAATTDEVWVEIPYPPQTLRVDARTGEVLESNDGLASADLPSDADRIRRDPPATDTVKVSGGQDDPLVGRDVATGEEIWRAVGAPVYDNVWAADDATVYVRGWDDDSGVPRAWIAAYDVASGDQRWRIAAAQLGWPWHVANGRLFAMWFDLQVIDASDGSILWATSFGEPPGGYPRMFGAVTNGAFVFVSFTSSVAGGD